MLRFGISISARSIIYVHLIVFAKLKLTTVQSWFSPGDISVVNNRIMYSFEIVGCFKKQSQTFLIKNP